MDLDLFANFLGKIAAGSSTADNILLRTATIIAASEMMIYFPICIYIYIYTVYTKLINCCVGWLLFFFQINYTHNYHFYYFVPLKKQFFMWRFRRSLSFYKYCNHVI